MTDDEYLPELGTKKMKFSDKMCRYKSLIINKSCNNVYDYDVCFDGKWLSVVVVIVRIVRRTLT